MRRDLLLLALTVGASTWAFRALPLILARREVPSKGPLARFLAATGPAAIATLATASTLPLVQSGAPAPLIAGVSAVLGLYALRRSVILATLGGALAYGLAVWAGV